MRWGDINIWVRRGGAAVTALAVVGGGYLFIQQRSPEHRLSEACAGALPVTDMLAMTGEGDFKLTSWEFDVSSGVVEPAGLATSCKAGGVQVEIQTASGAHLPFGDYTFHRRDDVLPVPLDSGWAGFIVAEEEDELGVSVLLDCPNWTPRQGSGILVFAGADVADSTNPASRTRLARIATGTAQRAADRTGCEATPGSRIDRVAPVPAAARPTTATKGTCAGMTSRRSAQETPAGTAPVEYCVLDGGLVLRAAYGPFVGDDDKKQDIHDDPAGILPDTAWASATCKGAQATALYWAVPAEDDTDRSFTSQPLSKSERNDLRHFARASATRHGCSTPTLPGRAPNHGNG
jgi:hypothetical protein